MAAMITNVRIKVRKTFGINGNPIEDFFAALLFYPGVAVQLNHAAKDAFPAKVVQQAHATKDTITAIASTPPTEIVVVGA